MSRGVENIKDTTGEMQLRRGAQTELGDLKKRGSWQELNTTGRQHEQIGWSRQRHRLVNEGAFGCGHPEDETLNTGTIDLYALNASARIEATEAMKAVGSRIAPSIDAAKPFATSTTQHSIHSGPKPRF